MAGKNYIPFVIAALVIGFIAQMFYPPLQAYIAGNWLLLILLGAGLTAIAGYFIKPLQIAPKKNQAIFGVVLLAIFGITTGMFGGIIPTAAFGPAAITPVTTAPATTTITLSSCQQSVSPDILGSASTVYANAYNLESNTPYSASVDTHWYIIKSDGTVQSFGDSTAATASGFSVGDVISIRGGNSTAGYYLEPKDNICLTGQSFPLNMEAHATATGQQVDIIGYDSTSATALSGGTNASQEDYDITLGADQSDIFYLRLRVNTTNVAFQLSGLATISANDISEVKPASGQGFSKSVVPKFLDTPITLDDSVGGQASTNITGGFEDLYVLSNPVMLHEWDEVKYKFEITAGATDPANNEDPSASDVAVVCFFDGSWARAGDGSIQYGIYQQDDNEANIGSVEEPSVPMATGACVQIEGI